MVPEREPPDWESLLKETEARVDEERAHANVAELRRAELRRSERDARALADSLARRLDDALPGALVAWLAEQVAVPSSSLSGYGLSDAARSSYRRLAIRHPDLRAFVLNLHMETAIGFAARGAFDADDECRIMVRLTHDMRA